MYVLHLWLTGHHCYSGPVTCSGSDYRCSGSGGMCISDDQVCDGRWDCEAGDDEHNCNNTVTISSLKVINKTSTSVTLNWTSTGHQASLASYEVLYRYNSFIS